MQPHQVLTLFELKSFSGCDEIWCPSETQIGTKWFPWTIGNIDWGGSVGSEKSAQNAQTLFILFVIQGTVWSTTFLLYYEKRQIEKFTSEIQTSNCRTPDRLNRL